MKPRTDVMERAECAELLELATPAIYRHNLFRVLGIAVDSRAKDIQRLLKRSKMQAKLGKTQSEGSAGPLVIDPPPGEQETRWAMERLNDPIRRFLDSLFWFWPVAGNASGDAALQALAQGQVQRATEIWRQHDLERREKIIAEHNLAVLDHMLALDYSARHETKGLDKKELRTFARHCQSGLAGWNQLLDNDLFWEVAQQHATDLNDTQLTANFVRSARESLPSALLSISARLMYAAAERGDRSMIQTQLQVLREANFSTDIVEQAIRDVTQPVRRRITATIESAREKWQRAPSRANQHVRDMHAQAMQLLEVVDAILSADAFTRGGLYDLVAEAMLDGQIVYGNKTDDWTECVALIDLADETAVGEIVKARIAENGRIVRANEEAGNNWCAPGYWDLPADDLRDLEVAHDLAEAGDFDGAIQALVVLNPDIGLPLRRALSYALSQRAISAANEAIGDANARGGVVTGSNRSVMSRAYQDLALASEMDPDDPGVAKAFRDVGRNATEMGADQPGTKRLKKRLAGQKTRKKPLDTPPTPDAAECAFCGEFAASDSCQITVPMCGDTRKAKQVFGECVEYRYTSIVVPRCRRCRDEHREHPERIKTWRASRAEASDASRFPELAEAAATAQQAHDESEESATQLAIDIAHWQAQVYDVDVLGRQCESCSGPRQMPEALCRKCDWHLFRLGAYAITAVLLVFGATALAAYIYLGESAVFRQVANLVFELVAGSDLLEYTVLPLTSALFALPAAGLLVLLIKSWKSVARKALTRRRRRAVRAQRIDALNTAMDVVDQGKTRLGPLRSEAQAQRELYQREQALLDEKRNVAEQAFERLHPMPGPAAGIKPEADFALYGPILAQRERGWGFGQEISTDGPNDNDEPVNVTGLVA